MTGRQRLLGGGLALLLGVGLALMAAGVAAVLLHDRPVSPEVVARGLDGRVIGGAEVDGSVVVGLTIDNPPWERSTVLVRLDPVTGREVERRTLAPVAAIDDLAVVDDRIVVRLRGRIPLVPSTHVWRPTTALRSGELWMVEVDVATLEPIHQYELAPVDDGPTGTFRSHEPLVVTDGSAWLLGTGMAQGPIDLQAGVDRSYPVDARGGIDSVAVIDGELIVVRREVVMALDLATGDELRRWRIEEDHGPGYVAIWTGFRLHGNEIWILEADRETFEVLYSRLDLVTGARTPGRLDDRELASWSFLSGGHRWEMVGHATLGGERESDVPPDDDTPFRWRQIDPTTGREVARFHLGSWSPSFASTDHLWVIQDEPSGMVLARVPLPVEGGEG